MELSDAECVSSTEAGDAAGMTLGGGADFTGDGRADLWVGAPLADDGGTDAGRVYVLRPGLALADADAVLSAERAGDEAGTALAAADMDGDGVVDLLVGADHADAGAEDAGAVYVLYGPIAGAHALADADARVIGDDADDHTGSAVVAGDLDADGVPDLVVGAYGENVGGVTSGAALVFYGAPTGDVYGVTADARLSGEVAYDRAGSSLAAVGDVDGDGTGDLFVSAHYESSVGASAGAAYLVRGPVYGAISLGLADAKLTGEAAGDFAGVALAAAGDVDGDGWGDVLVAAPGSDRAASEGGAIFAFFGGGL